MPQEQSLEINWQTVELMASDMAGKGNIQNEAQKALGYLLSVKDIPTFFLWLKSFDSEVTRKLFDQTKNTVNNYREVNQICTRYLEGLSFEEAAPIFAWAVRLARVYRNNPGLSGNLGKSATPGSSNIQDRSTKLSFVELPPAISPELEKLKHLAIEPEARPEIKPVKPLPTTGLWVISKQFVANVIELGKNVTLEASVETTAAKPSKIIIRKEQKEGYNLIVGQELTVEVIKVDDNPDNYVVGCQIISGADKTQVTPAVQPQPKKNSLNDILEKMKQDNKG